jgi:tetratricopeptide (TPR) repeat protein
LLVVLFIATLVAACPAPECLAFDSQQTATAEDPDLLYADRTNLASAQRAAALWEERLGRDPMSFESAWKLARAHYWLGGHAAIDVRRKQYERGIEAGKRAISIGPRRPEGHFWMAANMGALAESYGLRAGLKYRGAIKDALETVLEIDPAFQHGSADRALGRWYQKVPGLFGGSRTKSVEHLRRSLTYNPNSTASHYFLAETLFDMNQRAEARAELQKVLDAPIDPEWAPEDREFKEKAKARLAQRD